MGIGDYPATGRFEMRAVAFSDFGVAPRIHELPVPEPGPGEVLVRMSHSSINGFDVAVAAGMVKGMMEHRFPLVSARTSPDPSKGSVDASTTVTEGDQVFGVLIRDYIGDGTFAEFVVVPEAIGLAKIPIGSGPGRRRGARPRLHNGPCGGRSGFTISWRDRSDQWCHGWGRLRGYPARGDSRSGGHRNREAGEGRVRPRPRRAAHR